jgi:transcriptional regulator with XRE-family HTH domain
MQNAATTERDLSTFLLVEQFDANAIGARIKHARIEAGLTQEDLADLAEGFGKRSLQAYETGGSIPFKHLREIGTLLSRETAWFLYGDPNPPKDANQPILDRLQELEGKASQAWADMAAALRQIDASLGRIEARLPGEVPRTHRAR